MTVQLEKGSLILPQSPLLKVLGVTKVHLRSDLIAHE